ncbi:EthD domain-containing protein [Nocardia sp. CA-120079]|uniref:EthD domain-containing protein n=1 Tax=Nocardia sp. CA-120079 TaxID=3239974 RepID=UPI003D976883
MTFPIHTSSMLSPLMLRGDMPREVATTYWASTHADKVEKLPNLVEYTQRHFSTTDHGFWPATAGVGTRIPEDWRLDGCAELRFRSTVATLMTAPYAREVYLDEQNVFGKVIGHVTGPGGGRWWTDGFDETIGHHVMLLLRRRSGVRGSVFREFVHGGVGRALLDAGVRDVRTYTFLPWTRWYNTSPGVCHDNPLEHRHHGAVVFGVPSRGAVDELLRSHSVTALIDQQHTACTAVHAYSVERSVPVVRAYPTVSKASSRG